jgi:hypothetical protein
VGGNVPWSRGSVRCAGSTIVPAKPNSWLQDDDAIMAVVRSVVARGQLRLRGPSSLFMIISSADIRMPKFCNEFCGYHSYGNVADPASGRLVQVKQGFVGSVAACFSACSDYGSSSDPTSINNNPEADGTASILAHEIVEAISDPNLDAWYDGGLYENADKCSWEFGPGQQQTWDGKRWNTEFGGRKYLIQGNWNPTNNPATGWQVGCAWNA